MFFMSSAPVLAQNALDKAREGLGKIGDQTGLGTVSSSGDAGVYQRLAFLMNTILGAVGIIAVIYIIYAGTRWIRAGGKEEDIKEAKDTIRAALWGLVIIFGAFVIVNFVINRLV